MAGGICWAVTQAVGRSSYSRSGSGVLEFGFNLDSLVHTYIVNHIYTQFELDLDSPELLLGWGLSVL